MRRINAWIFRLVMLAIVIGGNKGAGHWVLGGVIALWFLLDPGVWLWRRRRRRTRSTNAG